MTSLIKPVPQREIEEKKQGSGERTAQILKKKAKGMNMDHNTLLGVLIPFVGTCIFRKNCASVPEERSAIPLQTEQSSAG